MSSSIYEPISKDWVRSIIKPRKPDSHKGIYGHALVIAGSSGKMGAAVLATRACLRTGAGLVTAAIPLKEHIILQTAVPEAMLVWRKQEIKYNDYDAIGIGPGIGTKASSVKLVEQLLENYKKRILLDADALNIIAKQKKLFQLIPQGSILTPHPKEFDRLFGESSSTHERMQKAIQLSAKCPWVIVLKGHETLVAFDGKANINKTGNAGLAKGGSGDMLSGMITALMAQGYESFDAAKAAVYLHGLSADIALKEQSMESMLATDVIECIGKAFTFIAMNPQP